MLINRVSALIDAVVTAEEGDELIDANDSSFVLLLGLESGGIVKLYQDFPTVLVLFFLVMLLVQFPFALVIPQLQWSALVFTHSGRKPAVGPGLPTSGPTIFLN